MALFIAIIITLGRFISKRFFLALIIATVSSYSGIPTVRLALVGTIPIRYYKGRFGAFLYY